MTTWTEITDAALEPGKPIRSVDGLALRDNAIAISEGSSGAPKIQNAALDTNSVSNVKVVNATLGAEKFQTGTTERDWVLGRTSDAGAGAVGTYAMLSRESNLAKLTFGNTVSGSSLRPSNADESDIGSTLSGTWRCMGETGDFGGGDSVTVFLRIS